MSAHANVVLNTRTLLISDELAAAYAAKQAPKPTLLQRQQDLRNDVEDAMIAADPNIAPLVSKFDKAHPIVIPANSIPIENYEATPWLNPALRPCCKLWC